VFSSSIEFRRIDNHGLANMWNDRKYLELLGMLADRGYLREFECGDVVGRGFADVGYEEFVVLPNARLCSLYTGQVVDLPASDGQQGSAFRYHFLVPTLHQLGDIICRAGFENIKIETELGAFWRASCEDGRIAGHDNSKREAAGGQWCKTPEEALASVFLQSLSSTEE
jgi:hypothetical protein